MPRIQQSVEVNLPVRVIYNQLTQFEDYPRFMQDVELVQQVDDTHLHWKAKMADQDMEWDAEITEQIPDQCIAWHNMSGPKNAGRIEVQPAGPDMSRVTMTMDAEQGQVPGSSAGGGENEMSQRLADNLTRLKEFIENRGSETGEWRGEIRGAQVTSPDGNRAIDAGSDAGQETGAVAKLGVDQGTGQADNAAGRRGQDEVAVLGSAEGQSSHAAAGNLSSDDQQQDDMSSADPVGKPSTDDR